MNGPVEKVLAALSEHGLQARKAGAGWSCRCPAHEDGNPSLSIRTGRYGRALVHCHAGCTADAVCGSIGLRLGDLFNHDENQRTGRTAECGASVTARATARKAARNAGSGDGDAEVFPTASDAVADWEMKLGRHSVSHQYYNADGDLVGQVVRWNTPEGKVIRPVSLNAAGTGWVKRGMLEPRPLHALPELLALPKASRIYVTEGEKAADAARSIGLSATTSPHGSESASKADWSTLSGCEVVVLPDHDSAGEKYAADVARLVMASGAKAVRIVRLVELWAGMPKGGDMADLVENRGGDGATIKAELETLIEKTRESIPEQRPIDGAPVIVRLSEVRPEPVSWLWPGRIALGKLTLIAGDPGLGKSFLTLDMAARVSRGRAWPDDPGVEILPGGVVLLSAEDGVADTIRPRLDSAGADISRIVALEAIQSVGGNGLESARMFDLSRDLPALELAIRSVGGCRLVVIDPVTAYLGGVDSHKNADIRGLLAPLSAIAERHRVAIVAVTHLNKSGGGPAIYRTMGSLAFAAAARAAWAVTKDKDDPRRRLLLPIKNNLAPDTGGLAYRIEARGINGCPVVVWEPDAVQLSADDALAVHHEDAGERTERDDAAEWLAAQLAHGSRPARDMERDAKDAGYSLATIRRAKAAIGVKSIKSAFGGHWEWGLPDPSQDAQQSAKMLTPEGVSTLGDGERLGKLVAYERDGWGEL